MMNSYAVNLNNNLSESVYKYFLSLVSKEKQESIKKYRRVEDAQRTLIADILLRTIICNDIGINNKSIIFERNEYGKPFLKSYPDFHFNISHSGDWVVCCTHDLPIGIDVEQIKPIDFAIAKRFFTTIEYKDLMSKNDSIRLPYFYELWTLKESYIKAVGKGLTIPLDSFTIRIDKGDITFCSNCQTNNYYFKQFNINEDYKMAVCSGRKEFLSGVKFIDVNELFERIF